jgi:hypothetical protein
LASSSNPQIKPPSHREQSTPSDCITAKRQKAVEEDCILVNRDKNSLGERDLELWTKTRVFRLCLFSSNLAGRNEGAVYFNYQDV